MAAGSKSCEIVALQKPCRKCKIVAMSGPKCCRCDTVTHNGCVKYLKNVIHINSGEIVCCANEDLTSNEAVTNTINGVEADHMRGKKVDGDLFPYIIQQKDILIKELYDKIHLLHNQIELLNENISLKNKFFASDKPAATKSLEQKTSSRASKPIRNKTDKTEAKNPTADGNSETTTNNETSIKSLKEETKLTMDRFININSDMISSEQPVNINKLNISEGFQRVAYSKNKNKKLPQNSMVIGRNTEILNSLKGVPKLVDLHLYRVAPNTTTENLTAFLKEDFPEVSCEALKSKHPHIYSSFRIKVFEKNLQKVMDPNLWPEDACIRRFFFRRNGKSEIG